MAIDPQFGSKITASVVSVKGKCNAGHKAGDSFDISCYNPGGLCGFLFHDIFPHLQAFQFGGNMPWWEGDTIQLQCPDSYNVVTIKLERTPRAVQIK